MSSGRDWSVEVDTLIELLDRHYLDAGVAERVGDMLRQRLADGAYLGLGDDEAFAAAVTEDTMAASGDLHLRLRYSMARLPGGDDLVVPESGRSPHEATLGGHGFAKVERLDGNVGLVDIRRFFPLSMSRPAAIAAMNLVADADALVVDLRQCAGGEPEMVAFVCTYLFDGRVHLDDLYFPADDHTIEIWTDPPVPGPAYGGEKPIWVLVGPATFSAGEGFAYDLQQLGRAVLVGETTAGAANFDYRYRVGNHLMFSVPSGHPVNPVSGGHWEGTGVAPDVPAGEGAAFATAYRLALGHVLGLGAEGYRRPVHDEAAQALADMP